MLYQNYAQRSTLPVNHKPFSLFLATVLLLNSCFFTNDEPYNICGTCPAIEAIPVQAGAYTETTDPAKKIRFDRKAGILTVEYVNEYGEPVVETWRQTP